MPLTCTWVHDQSGTGKLVMKWTADHAPVRHRTPPRPPGLSDGRHRD
jgi:hypothetical protein